MIRNFILSFIAILAISCSGSDDGSENQFASDNPKIYVDGKTFENDRIRFEIIGADDKSQEDGKGAFNIKTKVTNLDKNKFIFSPKWSANMLYKADLKGKVSTIVDEHGNLYLDTSGVMDSDKIMPEKSAESELIFMQLVPTAQKLKMTLIGNDFTDGKDLVFNLNRNDLESK